jgi:TolB-like protein
MMRTKEVNRTEEIFPENLIYEQIQRIFLCPAFSVSEILRRFLTYIIRETLAGRSNTIKEYTIALNVLNKPAGFKPQHDAIVRIHAGRLRRALNYYYREEGLKDEIGISVPKGSYVPVFGKLQALEESMPVTDRRISSIPYASDNITLMIIPFTCLETNHSRLSFAEGLGRQLCGEFGKLPEFSVISYYAVSELLTAKTGIRTLASNFSAQFMMTGNVQFESGKLRADVQLSEISTGVQIWTELYQYEYNRTISFELTDVIVTRVMDALSDFKEIFHRRLKKGLMISYLDRKAKTDARIRKLG